MSATVAFAAVARSRVMSASAPVETQTATTTAASCAPAHADQRKTKSVSGGSTPRVIPCEEPSPSSSAPARADQQLEMEPVTGWGDHVPTRTHESSISYATAALPGMQVSEELAKARARNEELKRAAAASSEEEKRAAAEKRELEALNAENERLSKALAKSKARVASQPVVDDFTLASRTPASAGVAGSAPTPSVAEKPLIVLGLTAGSIKQLLNPKFSRFTRTGEDGDWDTFVNYAETKVLTAFTAGYSDPIGNFASETNLTADLSITKHGFVDVARVLRERVLSNCNLMNGKDGADKETINGRFVRLAAYLFNGTVKLAGFTAGADRTYPREIDLPSPEEVGFLPLKEKLIADVAAKLRAPHMDGSYYSFDSHKTVCSNGFSLGLQFFGLKKHVASLPKAVAAVVPTPAAPSKPAKSAPAHKEAKNCKPTPVAKSESAPAAETSYPALPSTAPVAASGGSGAPAMSKMVKIAIATIQAHNFSEETISKVLSKLSPADEDSLIDWLGANMPL